MLLTKRVEVILNPFKDALGFVFSEPFCQPSIRSLVTLTLVTSALASLLGIAQGDDVARYSTGGIGIAQRYPVIGGNNMPQTGRPTTYRTTPIEVIKGALPIGGSKIVGQVLSSCPSFAYRNLLAKFPVRCFVVPFAAFSIHRWVFASMFARVATIALSTPKIQAIFCALAWAEIICVSGKVPFTSAAILVSIGGLWFGFSLLNFVCVTAMRSAICIKTDFASPTQPILAIRVAVKVFRGCRKLLTAFRAVLRRGIHSASLSLSRITEGIGGRCECRFSGISLADISIISQGDGIMNCKPHDMPAVYVVVANMTPDHPIYYCETCYAELMASRATLTSRGQANVDKALTITPINKADK